MAEIASAEKLVVDPRQALVVSPDLDLELGIDRPSLAELLGQAVFVGWSQVQDAFRRDDVSAGPREPAPLVQEQPLLVSLSGPHRSAAADASPDATRPRRDRILHRHAGLVPRGEGKPVGAAGTVVVSAAREPRRGRAGIDDLEPDEDRLTERVAGPLRRKPALEPSTLHVGRADLHLERLGPRHARPESDTILHGLLVLEPHAEMRRAARKEEVVGSRDHPPPVDRPLDGRNLAQKALLARLQSDSRPRWRGLFLGAGIGDAVRPRLAAEAAFGLDVERGMLDGSGLLRIGEDEAVESGDADGARRVVPGVDAHSDVVTCRYGLLRRLDANREPAVRLPRRTGLEGVAPRGERAVEEEERRQCGAAERRNDPEASHAHTLLDAVTLVRVPRRRETHTPPAAKAVMSHIMRRPQESGSVAAVR